MSKSKSFVFPGENTTLGELIQTELLKNKDCIYAGYIKEHPAEEQITLKVISTTDPEILFKESISNLIDKFKEIKKEINN